MARPSGDHAGKASSAGDEVTWVRTPTTGTAEGLGEVAWDRHARKMDTRASAARPAAQSGWAVAAGAGDSAVGSSRTRSTIGTASASGSVGVAAGEGRP